MDTPKTNYYLKKLGYRSVAQAEDQNCHTLVALEVAELHWDIEPVKYLAKRLYDVCIDLIAIDFEDLGISESSRQILIRKRSELTCEIWDTLNLKRGKS